MTINEIGLGGYVVEFGLGDNTQKITCKSPDRIEDHGLDAT